MTDLTWWDPYTMYALPQLEEHGLVPTDTIEPFEYEKPFPLEAVPCHSCRGQGVYIERHERRMPFYEDLVAGEQVSRDLFRIKDCMKCHGETELTFLCSECGTLKHMKLRNGDEVVQHEPGCRYQEYCMEHIESGSYGISYTYCRHPVVERFDMRADGVMVGYCGIHARNKAADEARAKQNKEYLELQDWRYAEKAKSEKTDEDFVKEIAIALGYPEGEYPEFHQKITPSGEYVTHLTLPIFVLKAHLKIQENEPEKLVEKLEIEVNNDPEPF